MAGGGAVKVYGAAASPYVVTVLMCLEEAGAAYEVVHLDMAAREQKAPHHLARNPFGTIPAMEDGELTLFGTPCYQISQASGMSSSLNDSHTVLI